MEGKRRKQRFQREKSLRIYVLKKIIFKKEQEAYRKSIDEYYMKLVEDFTKNECELIGAIDEITAGEIDIN